VDQSNFQYDKCEVRDMHSYHGGNLAHGETSHRHLTSSPMTITLTIIFNKEFIVIPVHTQLSSQ
jgi:hypothetical protein